MPYIEQITYMPIRRDAAERTLLERFPGLTNAQAQRQLDAAERVVNEIVFVGTLKGGGDLYWVPDHQTCQNFGSKKENHFMRAVTRRMTDEGYRWLCDGCANLRDDLYKEKYGDSNNNFSFADIFSVAVNAEVNLLPKNATHPTRAEEIPAGRQSNYLYESQPQPRICRYGADGNRILVMNIECEDPEGEATWIAGTLTRVAFDIQHPWDSIHITKEPLPPTEEERLRAALAALAADYASLNTSEYGGTPADITTPSYVVATAILNERE